MIDTLATHSPVARVRALWRVRKIFWLLVRRDLKVRYADSALGYFWTILDPLLMSLIYWALFTTLFDRNVGEDPYIVFLLAGMLPWQWFTSSVNQASKALGVSSRLIGSTDLPREIWVLRIVAANGIEYLLSLPVLAAFAIGYRVDVSVGLLLLIPVAVLIQAVLLAGLGLLLAPLVVLVPDIGRLVKIVLRLLFYASPVLYSSDRLLNELPEGFRWLYPLNPLADLLQFYRVGFFPNLLNWAHVGIAAGISSVVLAFGWFVFARLERTVLKEI